jgi:hypothetical protein
MSGVNLTTRTRRGTQGCGRSGPRHRARSALGAGLALSLTVACGGGDAAEPGGLDGRAGTTGGGGSGGVQATGGAGADGRSGSGSVPDGGGAGGIDDVSSGSGLSPRLDRYHRSEPDRALRFELDAVAGLEPYPSSTAYLAALVARAVDKPDGVTFEADETLSAFGSDHVWTFTELDAYSREHASDDTDGVVTIHVLLTDGQYDGGDDSGTVLGLAWGQRYIALFQDPIRERCSGGALGGLQMSTCEIAERSVWAHEIGHVIGLVDNGLAQQTPHRDADHGRHDISDGCLMYWAYERPELFDVLLARLTANQDMDTDFCANCWADLNAAKDD